MKLIFKKTALMTFALTLGMSFSAHAERVRLLAEDMEALQARVSIIQGAKKEILAEYFSVWNDDQSVGGFAFLLNAAKSGIKVKILMDAMSNTVPNSMFAALMDHGKDAAGNKNLEIKVYNPFSISNIGLVTHRDHAKMLIVDAEDQANSRFITGGRNVGDKYFGLNKKRNFRDLDVLTEGAVALEARENFMEVWNSDLTAVPEISRFDKIRINKACVGDQFRRESCERAQANAKKMYQEQVDRVEKLLAQLLSNAPEVHVDLRSKIDWLEGISNYEDVRFLSHQPDVLVTKETNDMASQLMKLALSAKKELNILSPYLIPTENMMKIFRRLIERNVKVRIVTNSLHSTDNLLAQAGYKGSKEALIKMGIELYEYNGPDTAHGKVAVIDGKTCVVGTYNLDPRSTFINREVGLSVRGEDQNQLAVSLTEAIEEFRENSLLVGKDGLPQNKSEWDKGVSKKKMMTLKALLMMLPYYREQI